MNFMTILANSEIHVKAKNKGSGVGPGYMIDLLSEYGKKWADFWLRAAILGLEQSFKTEFRK